MPFLDWVNKNQAKDTASTVPYHLLQPEASYGDADAGNLVIQGDNLLALKALLPLYAGQVKCIFIDPPYNTKSAFEHYDDRLEHSQWLSMMYPRLVLLRELLSENGSIWVTIDDNEAHYLKVLMDEIFGRANFVVNVLWQKRTSPDARLHIGDAHDHLLLYCKSRAQFSLRKIPLNPTQASVFSNPDNDPRGPWASTDFTAQGWRPNQMYPIVTPGGTTYTPPPGRCWSNVESEYLRLRSEGRLWFGQSGNSRPRVKNYLSEHEGVRAWSWWPNTEVGHNQEAKKEIIQLFGGDSSFETPKPERLIHRVIDLATGEGDLVLDSFLGSGTTAAVAHKMNRRYIGIEWGEHARTHCLPRLQKVIEGDQGGISGVVNWEGGGGFSFFTLGEPAFDDNGRLNAAIKFSTLAAYIWQLEVGMPRREPADSPFLGIHEGKAYFLLYNGILGDRRPSGGNVLTSQVLVHLRALCAENVPYVVYGETSRLGPARMATEGVTFKQIPYDVTMR